MGNPRTSYCSHTKAIHKSGRQNLDQHSKGDWLQISKKVRHDSICSLYLFIQSINMIYIGERLDWKKIGMILKLEGKKDK